MHISIFLNMVNIENLSSPEMIFTDVVSVFVKGFFITISMLHHFPQILNWFHFKPRFFKKVKEISFEFGEDAKYYEYIMFIDKVEKLKPGNYRYVIFLNNHLFYEDSITISPYKK